MGEISVGAVAAIVLCVGVGIYASKKKQKNN